jgi:hypothetical protein
MADYYYLYKQVATFANLPMVGNNKGDAYVCLDTKRVYIWNGTAWEHDGTIITDGTSSLTIEQVKADTDIADALTKKHTQNTDVYLSTQVTNVLYVDNKRTDTYTANGTITKPFKNIQDAIDAIVDSSSTNKYCIEVAPGAHYTDPITINKIYITFKSSGVQGARITGLVTVTNPEAPTPSQITFNGIRISGGLLCLASDICINVVESFITGSDWIFTPTVSNDDEFLQVFGGVWYVNVTLVDVYAYLMGGGYYSTFDVTNKEFNINNADINNPFQVTLNGTVIASAYGNRAGGSIFTVNSGAILNIDADTEGGSIVTVNSGAIKNQTTKSSNITNDSLVTGATVKDALETLEALVPMPATFQQFEREYLLVGDGWTITHVSDPNNKRIIEVKTSNGGTGTMDITPDNIGDFIQEDNTKTGFIEVLDHNANPIEAFALKNHNPLGVIDGIDSTPVTPGVGYEADTTHYLNGGNNDASIYIDSVDETGAILTLHLVSGGSGYYYGYYSLLGSGDGGAVVSVTSIAPDTYNYDTSKGWYVSTTNASQLNSSSWIGINNLRFDANLAGSYSQSIPVGTQIRYLISMDGRVTWKAWNGSAWVTVNLADIDTDGNTQEEIQSFTIDQWSLLFIAGTFDIVGSLKTTDSTVTPYISEIDVNYIIPGYQGIEDVSININEINATHTLITNISTDTLVGLKANILISQV